MTIKSASEFEATVGRIILKVERELVQRPSAEVLKDVRRKLEKAQSVARNADTLKTHKDALASAGEVLREQLGSDQELLDMTWDILDYIDYQLA